MEEKIKQRVILMASIFLKNNSTVREVAKLVGYSKSTVHKDLTEKLPMLDRTLYDEVSKLLNFNKEIRHIRGGQSTKLKYSHIKWEFEFY